MQTGKYLSSVYCVLTLVSVLLISDPVSAAEPVATGAVPTVRPRSVATLRISTFSGIPDLVGLSASLTALRPFELEVGVSTMIFASGYYARAGVAPRLLDKRMGSKGWTLDCLLLAGYRQMTTIPFDVSDYFHGITADLGLEGIYWFSPHFGLDLELVLGGVYWVSSTSSSASPFFPDGRLSIGLAF